jgi:hypothetical protein
LKKIWRPVVIVSYLGHAGEIRARVHQLGGLVAQILKLLTPLEHGIARFPQGAGQTSHLLLLRRCC